MAQHLVLCPACRRSYDVTHVEPGSSFDCACGERVHARHRQPRAPRALRCSNCGGNLADGATSCSYCTAEVTLEELRLDSVCPSCLARASSGARFCMECGIELAAQAVGAEAVGAACPRGHGPLRARQVGEASVLECDQCAGLWLEPDAFDRVCRSLRDTSAPVLAAAKPVLVERADAEKSVSYIPCPTCADLMVRRSFGPGAGVVLDMCRSHGVWVDRGELEAIGRFLRAGGQSTLISAAGSSRWATPAGERKAWKPSPRKGSSSLFGDGVRDEGDRFGGLLDRFLGGLF